MYRRPMNRNHSRKVFTRGALNVHPKNTSPVPQRGGLRF